MKKILNWVLAATLICGASVFTSCNKPATDLSDKVQGKWIVADLDGEACPPLLSRLSPLSRLLRDVTAFPKSIR